MNTRTLMIIGCVIGFAGTNTALAFDKFVAVGTASKRGTYYPVGKTLCKFINAGRLEHRVRCVAYSTGGSVYNIQALTSGELDLGITRADLAYRAYKGIGQFAEVGANKNLRTVTNLYDTPVVVTVRKGDGIKTFEDFKGRRINIGNRGSGKRTIVDEIFKILGWNQKMFSKVTELGTTSMAKAFCDKKIDIMIEAIGLPSKLYDKVAYECDGVFMPLPQKVIETYQKKGPFFYKYKLPKKLNPNATDDIQTIGTKIVLMTLKRVHPKTIGIVAKSVFSDLKSFQKAQRALGASTPHSMLREGIHVPIHSGAKQYYDQDNLLAGKRPPR
ncbi:MAG: TAXI family TRAP transporter solute-binding subunit [Alphaproteobacteria bacterium]|nr:TAXI family TRAP transporter solute-binding subunit [Alphaproteobacteria bacterium]